MNLEQPARLDLMLRILPIFKADNKTDSIHHIFVKEYAEMRGNHETAFLLVYLSSV